MVASGIQIVKVVIHGRRMPGSEGLLGHRVHEQDVLHESVEQYFTTARRPPIEADMGPPSRVWREV